MSENESFLRKQAWDYFTIHAAQRITTFNFYIALSSLISTTYFSSFKVDSNLQTAQPALAIFLVSFSFIFWKLDKRNRYLIKNAEAALIIFEETENAADPRTKLFTIESMMARTPVKLRSPIKTILKRDLSYSNCLDLVFIGFAGIGLVEFLRELFHVVAHIPK